MNYHPFLILLLLVFVTNLEVGFTKTHHSNTTCSENDQKALIEFKNGLIDNSNRLSSWTGQNCCKWDGVFCDEKTGNVVKIDLHYKNYLLDGEYPQRVLDNHTKNFLGGELSPSLVKLKHLSYLDLSHNYFSSIQIPPFFGLLMNLRFLNLSCAGFGGYIPKNLGNLSRLEHLYLGGCYGYVIGPGNDLRVDSLRWISKFSSLKSFDLSQLVIEDTKDLWNSINMLPSLLSLNLEGCNLNILPSFTQVNFTSLSSLNIRDNMIGMSSENSSIIPPWFSNLTMLMNLHLGGQNKFDDPTNVLEKLSSLRVLDVSNNGFGDSLLSSLSKLNNLVYLDLLGNDIHFSSLHLLGNLTSLSVLKLRFNTLKGLIPEGLTSIFCRLSVLDLSDNEISGLLPTFIRDPSSCLENRLKELYMGNTKFSDFFPEGMSMHKNLEVIDSTNSLLYGEIPSSISKLSNLRFLRISNNKLNGSIPSSIGQLSNLEELDISENLFTGIVSELHFVKLSKLMKLHLSKNENLVLNVSSNWYPTFQVKEIGMASVKVGPDFPQWLQKQSILDTLIMSDANISDMIPNWLSNITLFMTTLDLSVNKLVGGISVLCDAQLLNSIDLSKNLLSGLIPSCLSNLEELSSLNLADNSLEGEIPSSLGDLTLRFLHLQKNNLQGKIPLSFQNLTWLERLDLGENKLKDVFPTWIGEKLQSLELLRLNSNQFYGVIPLELCQISSLCWLNLAGNNLYGTIPSCFGNFSCGNFRGPGEVFGQRVESFMKGIPLEYVGEQILFLRILDLSENKLVGGIPKELTKLVDFQYLNLSRNSLNGSIPKKIGDLKQLESLDLSHNKLSGSIPQSLASLNYLSYMNLSYNDFSGPIPTGNQLQSLDDQSFYVGNPRLCGILIKKSCNGNGTSHVNEQTPQGDDHDQDVDEHKWFYAGIAPGFCVGFLGVLFILYKTRNRGVVHVFQCLARRL
ncbi:receptor-like protein EIX2 [Solanum verrucosum]|uniref:receptor-like protein EIX2 n=1 Tax=Solanum verrucosum TaxID=315347 RepID=UPI0020D098B4|nr:receptor-like protein EIX2 [Solanum verrucosum]